LHLERKERQQPPRTEAPHQRRCCHARSPAPAAPARCARPADPQHSLPLWPAAAADTHACSAVPTLHAALRTGHAPRMAAAWRAGRPRCRPPAPRRRRRGPAPQTRAARTPASAPHGAPVGQRGAQLLARHARLRAGLSQAWVRKAQGTLSAFSQHGWGRRRVTIWASSGHSLKHSAEAVKAGIGQDTGLRLVARPVTRPCAPALAASHC